MNYAPTGTDQRGSIFATGGAQAAQITAAGYDGLAQGISNAGKSIAGGIEGYGQKSAEAKKLTGVGEYYFKDNPQKLDAFHAGDLGTKQGMIAGYLAQKSDVESGDARAMQDWQHLDSSTRQWYTATKPEQSFEMSQEDRAAAKQAGYYPLKVSERGYTTVPVHSAKSEGVEPIVNPATSQVIGYSQGGKPLAGQAVKALTADEIAMGRGLNLPPIDSRIAQLAPTIGAMANQPSVGGLPGETYGEELARLRQMKDTAKRVSSATFINAGTPASSPTGGPAQPPALAQGQPAPASVTVSVKDKAGRDALPAGTRYVGPDGIVRIKQ